jgi:hypothetical protein
MRLLACWAFVAILLGLLGLLGETVCILLFFYFVFQLRGYFRDHDHD